MKSTRRGAFLKSVDSIRTSIETTSRWSHNDGRNRSRKALFALGLALVVISMMNLGLNMTTYYRARDDPLQEPPLSISRSSCRTPGIRREWRTLGPLERGNYISAVQCLSTKPSRLNINATLYDDFGYVHARVAKTSTLSRCEEASSEC